MYNLLSRFFKHKPLPKEQLDYIVDEVVKKLTIDRVAPSDLPVGETEQLDVAELAKLTPDAFNHKLYGSPTVSQQRDSQNVRSRPTPTTSINTTASNTHLVRNDTWITTPVFVDNTPSHSCSHSSSSDSSSSSSSCDSSSSSGGWD